MSAPSLSGAVHTTSNLLGATHLFLAQSRNMHIMILHRIPKDSDLSRIDSKHSTRARSVQVPTRKSPILTGNMSKLVIETEISASHDEAYESRGKFKKDIDLVGYLLSNGEMAIKVAGYTSGTVPTPPNPDRSPSRPETTYSRPPSIRYTKLLLLPWHRSVDK